MLSVLSQENNLPTILHTIENVRRRGDGTGRVGDR